MQNLLKSIHLQIFQPFPNSNWIGASKSQQKTKMCFTCKTGSDEIKHWDYHRCTSRYLHKSCRHSLPFLHQIRNTIPCFCAGNLYGLHVFGECFCVKATCCKCDFFLGNHGILFSWKGVSDDKGIMSDLSEVKKTVKLSEI